MGFPVESKTGRDRSSRREMSDGPGSRLPEVTHLATVIEARALEAPTSTERRRQALLLVAALLLPPETDGGS